VLTSSGGIVELEDENGTRLTDRFPEVRPLGRAVGYTEIAVDGVVTAPEGDEGRIARRLAAGSDTTRRRLARDAPITYVAVDLLWRDGHPLTDQPWHARRTALESLRLEGPAWTTPSAYTGDPSPMLEAAAMSGVQELIAKRVDGPYDPSLDPPPWRIVSPITTRIPLPPA
jgi:bifunctional non-homologous end joining protein LigD